MTRQRRRHHRRRRSSRVVPNRVVPNNRPYKGKPLRGRRRRPRRKHSSEAVAVMLPGLARRSRWGERALGSPCASPRNEDQLQEEPEGKVEPGM